jgi:anti-anti-sigma factor
MAIIREAGKEREMRDEDKFPTVRFLKCRACGQVYTGSLTGDDACPKCHAPHRAEAAPDGRITREGDGGHVLFTVRGSLHKIAQLEELRAQIFEAVDRDALSIAFAFEGSTFLNSSLINLLVKTMQTLSVRGRPTFVVTRDAEVLESLQMMDLDRVLRILPDLERYQAALA